MSAPRVAGEFVTEEAHPLYVLGRCPVPWLVERPGEGLRVRGQVFEVDDATLAAMDELEMESVPGWYVRRRIRVSQTGLPQTAPIEVFVYFGCASRLVGVPVHCGPIAEYTLADAAGYRDGEI